MGECSRARGPLWGDVLECEHGWRAECAYPVRVFLPQHRRKDRAHIAAIERDLRAYRVPVQPLACSGRADLVAALTAAPLSTRLAS